MADNNSKRGLASADEETRQRVASEGGSAPHEERGFETMDEKTHHDISVKGGQASHGGGRNSSDNESSEGRGWFGDSEGHSEAGKKGGRE